MEQKQKSTNLQDEGKLAYMIAWRDRRISALQELLQAHEQANSIYAAYVAYLLKRCGEADGAKCKLAVSKAEIREICGKFAVRAEDAGEEFIITLERLEENDAAGRCEVADA